MKIIGIVAEYNPFHKGHEYQIEAIRSKFNEDCAVVAVMSGDFVQRGDAAVFSKHARAKAAIMSGVDLCLELPLPWAVSSAQDFSRGAVSILNDLGAVDFISFGAECDDISSLDELAIALIKPEVNEMIKENLKSGVSYAKARHDALVSNLGEKAEMISLPNNILAVEYLRSLYEFGSNIKALPVLRKGAGHDKAGGSASDIRGRISGKRDFQQYVTKATAKMIEEETKMGRGPVFMETFNLLMLSRLRMLKEDDFNKLKDAGEGLGNRLYKASRTGTSIEGIMAETKTKRYALSRIRRLCMSAVLGIDAEISRGLPPYARILAANERGRTALNIFNKTAEIPIITKPASIKALPKHCIELFELESQAHDFYVLGYKAQDERAGGGDWRFTPTMIR